ncbi:hypothetical protein GCM10027047_30180 [Rhodococcus aerolatus]
MLDRLRRALTLAHLSGQSLLVGGAVALVGLLLWRPLTRRLGWASTQTLFALLLLAAVAALTLGPGGSTTTIGVRRCVRRAPRGLDATLSSPSVPLETALNVVMLLPLGVAVVLAARRLGPGLLVVLVVPAVVEVVQTRVPGRVCSGVDYATNASGGIVGVLLGGVLLLLVPPWRRDGTTRRNTRPT